MPQETTAPNPETYINTTRLLDPATAQALTPRVQVPNNHIFSKILTYITTILKPST